MLRPEITHYGEGKGYSGAMYRFPDAEHITVERSSVNVHIAFSTRSDPDQVRQQYELIFGIKAVIESDDEGLIDEEYLEAENQTAKAAMILGPMCVMIVDTEHFALSWDAPTQVFHDIPDKTPVVHMHQESAELDFRHKALVRALADTNVYEHLDSILPDETNI